MMILLIAEEKNMTYAHSKLYATRLALLALAATTAITSTTNVFAATIYKANNTDALNLGTSWTGGVAPGVADTIGVDGTVGAARTANLGANLSVLGIEQGVAGTPIVSNAHLTFGPTAGATLTIGSGGINKNSGAADIILSCAVTLGANQTWTINSTGGTRTLQLNTTAFSDGGKTLSVTGTGIFDLRPNGSQTLGSNVAISAPVNVNNAAAAVTLGGSNTFAALNIVSGKLSGSSFGNFGVASNFGSGGTSTAIVLGGSNSVGAFEYTGLSTSSNRTFTLERRSGINSMSVTNAAATLTLSGAISTGGTNLTGEKDVTLAVDTTGNLVINGIINDHPSTTLTTSVTKKGNGTLFLNGNGTATTSYLGSTAVSAGRLGGTGKIFGPVAISGTGILAPGQSIGTLTIQNTLTIGPSGAEFEISKTGAGPYTLAGDQVTGVTSLTYGGPLVVSLDAGSNSSTSFVAGDSWTLFSFSSITPLNTNFTSVSGPTLAAGLGWSFSPTTGVLSVVAIPEPTSLAAVGLLATLAMRRRRFSL